MDPASLSLPGDADRFYPLYVVLIGCGLRRGEALALTVDSIDFDQDVIHIRKTLQTLRGMGIVVSEPKTEQSRRTVAMPGFVRDVLRQYLRIRQ